MKRADKLKHCFSALGYKKGNKFIKNTKEYYIFKDLVNNRLLIPRVIQGE